ncbi:phosphoserine aminotransferase [Talaromyces stipitatus ATCC 10500]|uniref:phosphoserine transaminase n=1 Tax=Talaromyces stipitatus (strain ATCC 10500 / CBS 375.48 / QM 6759 / NRRL 1006) TaxID=441959 RepID=B8MCI4_TALSN|nr:phosphoserine aminotransferase [Talaromyces stipitatus ATCC 10500]EED18800.1 phosphoserine aminotransferase [Talaromyces stipitatus ATCC 10500]
MKREDVVYFGAGPAGLPTDVLTTAASALLNYQETGLGVAEHSHRSTLAADIVNTMKADLAEFLEIPPSHDVLIMQGGGSGQFDATVYNSVLVWVETQRQKIVRANPSINEEDLIKQLQQKVQSDLRLDYLVTGSWSLKANQEAVRLLGPTHVNVATDSRKLNDGKFGKIADESTWQLSDKPAMIYLCENETVDGVEWPSFPKTLESRASDDQTLVVGDFSSTILSRRIPFDQFSIVYFGAQKNLGLPGITVVVIKKSLLSILSQGKPDLARKIGLPVPPTILDYAVAAKNNSLYNTLSIFDVFVAGQVLKKLLATFPDKVRGQEALSGKKAALLYGVLDSYPEVYKVVPDESVRSRMNLCFRVTKGGNVDEAERAFIRGATERGLLGLKGHRSVGGIRVSNYNVVDEAGAQKLATYLKDFATSP